ncbi:hypothetical protein FHX37_0050 [Haloactinospora alba]|uniref:Uncharacterized protein n=1 Tax=Haloactinospora alba TaxID=405555 RepID=A0A543NEH1_9ACTN|nr:hypothetical protein [Haloactinospora alba]TQN30189.1 hypothetical protein FHX37_0050 [Haloactinospora alba]
MVIQNRRRWLASARAACARSLELDVNQDPGLLLQAGRVHRWLGGYSAASSSLRDVLRLDPENVPARRELAELHARGMRLRRALLLYRSILATDPGADLGRSFQETFSYVFRWIFATSVIVGFSSALAQVAESYPDSSAHAGRIFFGFVLVLMVAWPTLQLLSVLGPVLRLLRELRGIVLQAALVLAMAVSAGAVSWTSGAVAAGSFVAFLASFAGYRVAEKRGWSL